jgi:3-hydroxybutyryl-CoA dehydrogenase
MNVAIIGAGPLGRWLALAAARAGFTVFLEDVMPANLHHAKEFLRAQFGPEALGEGFPGLKSETWGTHKSETWGTRSGVQFVSTIEDAVRQADLAIDCVPDELESKLEVFCLLDRMAPPRTVLLTPTTRLSIADLASCTYRADKCIAIVADARDLAGQNTAEGAQGEVLLRTTPATAPQAMKLVSEFWKLLGFTPRFELDPAGSEPA